MIRAVIFDLFGTLVHLPRDTQPYLRICRAVGEPNLLRNALVVDAPTLLDFCEKVGVAAPPNVLDLQNDLESDINEVELFPDSLPTLQSLREREIRTGLISNLASPYKRAVTELGIEPFFDLALYSCDLGIAKPNRAIFETAISHLGLPPESILMVGDSWRSDVDGANRCGMQSLLINRGETVSGRTAISTLADIMPCV